MIDAEGLKLFSAGIALRELQQWLTMARQVCANDQPSTRIYAERINRLCADVDTALNAQRELRSRHEGKSHER